MRANLERHRLGLIPVIFIDCVLDIAPISKTAGHHVHPIVFTMISSGGRSIIR